MCVYDNFFISFMGFNELREWLVCYIRQRSSLLLTSALRPYSGPVCVPRERRSIGRCVPVCRVSRDTWKVSSSSGIYSVRRAPSRCGLPSGLAMSGTVCYTSQWPAMSYNFSHVGAADNLDVANLGISNGHRFIEDTSNSFFLLRIISLFIGCWGIIWN